MTTLRDNAQKEGAGVLEFLERHSQRVLADHGFEPDAPAPEVVVDEITAGTDRRQKAEVVDEQLTAVVNEMGRRGFSPEQIDSVRQRAASAIHEHPAHCTNVFVDDVSVKKQKAHRERPGTGGTPSDVSTPGEPGAIASPAASDTGKSSRPQVANTVARIERGSGHFTLSAANLGQLLRFVLAFLLHNGLLGGRLHLFADGYRSLQDTLLAFFAWHPRVWLVLDWHHVVKKFKEDLSRACRAREVRNRHLRTLVRFLWYGMVTEAHRYLETIPAAELKDPASIERLRSYLERNECSIPCYALRRRLGLRNGSSPVESANNQVTARRQKRNGMSWSKTGSHALTALSVLVCNRCQAIWVREHVVPLRFVDNKAA